MLAGADTAAAAMEALDEEQLDQGAWDEDIMDIEGAKDDDVDAVGNEYEGGDEDNEGGWEMEARHCTFHTLSKRTAK